MVNLYIKDLIYVMHEKIQLFYVEFYFLLFHVLYLNDNMNNNLIIQKKIYMCYEN